MPRKVLGYDGFEYFAEKIKSEIANKTTSWNDLTDRPFYSETVGGEEVVHKLDEKYLPDSVKKYYTLYVEATSAQATSMFAGSVVLSVDSTVNSEASAALSDGKQIIVEITVQLLNLKLRIPLDGFGTYGSTTFEISGKPTNISATYSPFSSTITISVKELLNMPIQKIADYLYYFEPNFDLDYDKAVEYVREHGILSGSACSAVRKGNLLGRNLDWKYSETAEFIIRTKATKGRHASIGVATGLTDLTNAFAESGEWSELYRIIPFGTTDGINDRSVVVEMNTVSGITDYYATIDDDNDIVLSLAMIPRYILDYADSADHAIQLLQSVDIIPPFAELPADQHFMIADKTKTYVVEFVPDGNGGTTIEAIELSDIFASKPILTNFYMSVYLGLAPGYGGGTILGSGYNRYETLEDLYDYIISKQDMFNALGQVYSTVASGTTLVDRDGTQAHTVHAAVYDFENQTLTIKPQPDVPNPTGEVYTFAVNNGIVYREQKNELLVSGELNPSDFVVSNIDKTFAEIYEAYQNDIPIRLKINQYHPVYGAESLFGNLSLITDGHADFGLTLRTNMGDGDKVYTLRVRITDDDTVERSVTLHETTEII